MLRGGDAMALAWFIWFVVVYVTVKAIQDNNRRF